MKYVVVTFFLRKDNRVAAPDFELQPSVPINLLSVRRMAPNLLSPFISQPQTRQPAIRIDLKKATTFELVAMHDTSLTRGNLCCLEDDGWIGNDVVNAYYRLL
ncbi:hypothetical protein AAG906_014635 [Vitis piasezkii]